MSVLGKWRILEMPDYTDDYPDMMGAAYILFEATRGEFAFGLRHPRVRRCRRP